ncbi:MAG: glycosyl hydrolase [Calditrichaeota bacterium]|nr:glycosyl hydrolase [Calditrichota bacterium]
MRWSVLLKLSAIILFEFAFLFAQTNPVPPTPANERLNGYRQRLKLKQTSLVKNVPFRNVGPSVQSGRVVDIEGNPNNPSEFYVAYASGGLWHTATNGIDFTPLFDRQPVMTIGDIAVDWDHGGTIWVGSGESNSSRSSYSGTGIFRSDDGGKTWQHKGLAESHHIGRIVLHPNDPNTLWVAAVGHLYSPNEERGVYKSTDGGNSWRRVLYVNQNTGAIDLVIDPSNPDVLYAAMWERSRRAWDFQEAGAGSGIYKSEDGGEHWQLLTTERSGFQMGDYVGRIGLTIYPQNPQILYAFLDNQKHRKKKKEEELNVTKDLLRTISIKDFLKLNPEDLNEFLDRYNFPMEYNADTLFQLVRKGKIKPVTLVEYLEDANAELFETPVVGAQVFRSDDGGKTWEKTHEGYLDKVVYSFGYYFGNIRVSPADDQKIYVLGVPVLFSKDGGKSFTSLNHENVHVDHHALWIDPSDPNHLILGNDGGINISFDNGKTWFKANHPPVGQFYTVAVDMAKPYNVYGGMQDNGVWTGPSTNVESRSWHQTGRYAFKWILSGDGMQIAIDTRDNKTVYTGYQFGNYFRTNRDSGKLKKITPKHNLGERPLRFNWQTPIHLSVHNQDILYIGAQKVYRSMDRGGHWEAVSDDLTKGGKKGDVPYGTLTTIHESPLKFGLIYVGSDDGLVHVTKDGGVSWQRISDSLPQNYWVSRVQASAHKVSRVFVALNGYRWDNFEALIYRSEDYGKTWRQIGMNLPPEPVNVLKEDPLNEHILYAGTDHGVYVSLNDGKTFMAFDKGLSDAPVHDLVVHPREHDLVIGTHGRSIYIANMNEVEQLTPEILSKKLYLFPLKNHKERPAAGKRNYAWKFNQSDSLKIPVYCKTPGRVKITITGKDNFRLSETELACDEGLNYGFYDFSLDLKLLKRYVKKVLKDKKKAKKLKLRENGKIYLPPGEYAVTVEFKGERMKRNFKIEALPKKQRKIRKKIP